jgi:hypothetical protein
MNQSDLERMATDCCSIAEVAFNRSYSIDDFVITVRLIRQVNGMALQSSAGMMGPDGHYDCCVDCSGSVEEAVKTLKEMMSKISPPPPRINQSNSSGSLN